MGLGVAGRGVGSGVRVLVLPGLGMLSVGSGGNFGKRKVGFGAVGIGSLVRAGGRCGSSGRWLCGARGSGGLLWMGGSASCGRVLGNWIGSRSDSEKGKVSRQQNHATAKDSARRKIRSVLRDTKSCTSTKKKPVSPSGMSAKRIWQARLLVDRVIGTLRPGKE